MWGLREKVCSDWCNITKENCYWKKCIRCQQALEMMCSGHAMDIYDISWCPNSEFIVSSGTDSNVIIWGIDGAQYNRIHEHTGYIQGIDWSQDDATIVSVANDRTARVYSYAKGHGNACLQIDDPTAVPALRTEHRISKNIVNNKPRGEDAMELRLVNCRAVLKKMCYTNTPSEEMEAEEPETAESAKSSKGYYMFLGDTVPSFYRRPHSSSDGLFTLIPCGG